MFPIRRLYSLLIAVSIVLDHISGTGASYSLCQYKCSPQQIADAFNYPPKLQDTQEFCRNYLHIPPVKVTKVATAAPCKTATIYTTKTLPPVTIVRTKRTVITEEQTVTSSVSDISSVILTVNQENTETVTLTETDTIITTTETPVAATTIVTAIAFSSATVSITTTVVHTNTETVTSTVFFNGEPAKREVLAPRAYGQTNDNSPPDNIPHDLSPQQISSACKKLNIPPLTYTTTLTLTLQEPKVTVAKSVYALHPIVTVTVVESGTKQDVHYVTQTITLTTAAATSTATQFTTVSVTDVETTTTTDIVPGSTVFATETVTTTVPVTITSTIPLTSIVLTTTTATCRQDGSVCDISNLDNVRACCGLACKIVGNSGSYTCTSF